jgi:hypothetical protein
MADPTGEAKAEVLRLDFDGRLRLQFHGSVITSDGGLLAYRELDDVLGLTTIAGERLAEARTGRNRRHLLVGLLRQSVFGRLAGYEDVNDAERLCRDPAMRWVVGAGAPMGRAASASQMGRFETEWLTGSADNNHFRPRQGVPFGYDNVRLSYSASRKGACHMSVGVDFFKSEFLFQTFDTEVVWSWELTDDDRAMFYDVVPSPVPAMEFARVEVTRVVQRGSSTRLHRAVEIHVKLDFNGPAKSRPTLDQGLLNFHAVRVPGV